MNMDTYTHSLTPRPQHDTPYDLRPRAIQWDEAIDSDLRFLPDPIPMTPPQELFVLSPQATAYAYLSSNPDSAAELGGQFPDVNATSNPQPNRRQSQNREAQRRFRERREQERIQLRKKMEELRVENDALSRRLAEVKSANMKLEGDNERLQNELEMLRRRWRDVLGLMADMVQQEEESPTSSSSGTASSSSSRKEVQSSRSSIMMQMLVLLFDEKGGEGPPRTVLSRLGALSGIRE